MARTLNDYALVMTDTHIITATADGPKIVVFDDGIVHSVCYNATTATDGARTLDLYVNDAVSLAACVIPITALNAGAEIEFDTDVYVNKGDVLHLKPNEGSTTTGVLIETLIVRR